MDWPDDKIRNVAIRYIERASMEPDRWQFTRVGAVHDAIAGRVRMQAGELPVVSCFVSDEKWYVLTTRRIVGNYLGQKVEVSPADGVEAHFGNFEGCATQETEVVRAKETEVMALKSSQGTEAILEYETGRASMASIYYMRFWTIKFPVLDRLTGE